MKSNRQKCFHQKINFCKMRIVQTISAPIFLYFSENHDLAIVGSSIMHWSARRGSDTRARWRLLSATTTHWHSRRGMRWSQLSAACETLARADRHPRWLIIHLGGNDLASVPLRQLIEMIQKDMKSYSLLFPETCLIWLDYSITFKVK